jgi:DNA repair protein RecN (Recombination protein N)
MLRTLSIRDFVIVDVIELEFSSGFTVFTGETGAGKSILIDALTLALGGRGEASMVREGASRADISAEFATNPEIDAWLAQHECAGDEGSVLLRRVIDQAGRSKGFINGTSATAAQLREIGEMLVDIHGQHMHQSLLKTEAQRAMLDQQMAKDDEAVGAQLKAMAQAHKTWRNLSRQCEAAQNNARQSGLERERLEWQVAELEKLALKEGEWTEIGHEHSRLAHAASLLEGAQEALATISESDYPLLSRLSGLNQKLGKLVGLDDQLQAVLDCLEPARIHLQEAVYALNDYLGRIELDPQRLQQVEARLDVLHSMARKFRVEPEQLPAHYQQLAEQLEQLVVTSDLDGLRQQEQAALGQYQTLAKAVSRARHHAAGKMSTAVTAAMQELSMGGGRFEVALHPCEEGAVGPWGQETVEFLVAGHAGSAPRSLAKVASGGEMARIALAITVIAVSNTPTLIFDEVDSGIGGAVAEVVGRLLKRLGQQHQVLCVTHLPQVASQANAHFQVSKSTVNGSELGDEAKTVSRIAVLDSKARVEEVARMLGGVEITATTRRHARELLAS